MTRGSISGPRLTRAVPTLNRAHFVERAVASALAQTSQEIEVIVSDNGSTDDTPLALEKFRDPRLRKIRHARTMPASAHGNFLIQQSNGGLFLGLSDDDYLEPDFAERIIELFDRRPDLSFAYTGCWVHYGTATVPTLTGPDIESGISFIRAYFSGQREVCWCACVTRLDRLRAIGPIPDGRIFGDMFYWTKLAFEGSVGCVAAPLSHYTFMTDNLSSAVPVIEWARETRTLADEVLSAYTSSCGEPAAVHEIRRSLHQYVARSTANQFVWNAIRGRSYGSLARDVVDALPFLLRDPFVWPRVMAAGSIPRPWLKKLVLSSAASRARLRGSS
jgi:glycosyltransferase involved in cell wall biosynthesis